MVSAATSRVVVEEPDFGPIEGCLVLVAEIAPQLPLVLALGFTWIVCLADVFWNTRCGGKRDNLRATAAPRNLSIFVPTK